MERSGFFEFSLKEMGETGIFKGYASTFGNEDLQGDIVMPGAFARTLQRHQGRVPVLMAHNPGRVVGFGTSAAEDKKGLAVAGEFTLESDEGRNAHALARHASKLGHKLGLSIGYMIPEGGSTFDEKRGVRNLTEIDLMEYSIAAIPANPQARMTDVKLGDNWTVRDLENILRNVGVPRDVAKIAAAAAAKAIGAGVDDAAQKQAGERFMAELRAFAKGL